ncbi:MAG: hypothetical protein ABI367_08210 [Mucilaginibacter sp.]
MENQGYKRYCTKCVDEFLLANNIASKKYIDYAYDFWHITFR